MHLVYSNICPHLIVSFCLSKSALNMHAYICVCCCFSFRQRDDWLLPEGLFLPAECGNHGTLPGYKAPVCTNKQTWRAKINDLQAHPCMLWHFGNFPASNFTINEAITLITYFIWVLILTTKQHICNWAPNTFAAKQFSVQLFYWHII